MGDPDAAAARPLVACQDCGLLHKAPNRGGRGRVRCRRCGAEFYRLGGDGIHLALGLTLAALVLLVVANVFPLMTFRYEGREQGNVLISGVFELAHQGLWLVAALVFLVTIAVPATKLLGSLWVLLPLYRGRVPVDGARVFRLVETLHPWAMTEVYLLGLLVAYVKLADIADVALGPALFAFVALIVIMVAAEMTLEPRAVWERLQPSPAVTPPPREARDRLGRCQRCGLLSRLAAGDAAQRCPRCHAALHRRKPASISRTWALVLTGVVLYVPANLYPIMTVISFGRGEPDTILSGVVRLFEAGMWPLALLVFFASITVPVLKLAGLSFLLLSVQRRWRWRPRQRTLLYRVIDAVGRWSMIDIFMISILVALVKLGSIATVEPGIGATAFAAVVVVTMIAATAFDPRLIWDAMETPGERSR